MGTAPIITRGFGAWSTVNLVVTRGYNSGAAPAPTGEEPTYFLVNTGRMMMRKGT